MFKDDDGDSGCDVARTERCQIKDGAKREGWLTEILFLYMDLDGCKKAKKGAL